MYLIILYEILYVFFKTFVSFSSLGSFWFVLSFYFLTEHFSGSGNNSSCTVGSGSGGTFK